MTLLGSQHFEAIIGRGAIALAAALAAGSPLTAPASAQVVSAEIDFAAAAPTTGADSQESSVGASPDQFLIAWHAGRDSAGDLRVTRVARTGRVLDPTGIHLASNANRNAVAHDGTHFVVAYSELVGDQQSIRVQRVAADGTLVDAMPIAVTDGVRRQDAPRIACIIGRCLVVWNDGRGSEPDVRAARIDTRRGLLDPGGFVIRGGDDAYFSPDVATDGANFVVSLSHYTSLTFSGTSPHPVEILTVGVDAMGSLRGPSSRIADHSVLSLIPTAQTAIAHDGSHYLIAYNASAHVVARRLDAMGRPIDGPTPLSGPTPPDRETYVWGPRIAVNGGEFLVAWLRQRNESGDTYWDYYGRRVGADGNALADQLELHRGSDSTNAHDMAVVGGTSMLVWGDSQVGRIPAEMVVARRFDGRGRALDATPFRIAGRRPAQAARGVAFDGRTFALQWTDEGDGRSADAPRTLHLTRMAPDGRLLDRTPLAVFDGEPVVAADIAALGSGFISAFTIRTPTSYDSFALRLTADGTPRDSAPLVVADAMEAEFVLGAAGRADGFAVVYDASTSGDQLRAFAADGRPRGPGRALAPPASGTALGALGAGYLTVQSGGTGSGAIHATRHLADGAAIDRAPVDLATGYHRRFGIGGGTDVAVALFESDARSAGDPCLSAVRFAADGRVLDATPVDIRFGHTVDAVAAAAMGAGWIAAWVERPRGMREYGLLVQRLDASAMPIGDAVTLVDGLDDYDLGNVRVATDGGAQAVVSYDRRFGPITDPARAPRAIHLSYDLLPVGSDCATTSACESGACVDGVCCASACGGGATDDCLACAVSAGAAEDGLCAPRDAIGCAGGGICDTGSCVGALIDAGVIRDGGVVPDGGGRDAGLSWLDGGPSPDAGWRGDGATALTDGALIDSALADAALTDAAAPPDGMPPRNRGGCSCRLGATAARNANPGGAVLLVIVMLGVLRHRRSRRRRSVVGRSRR